MEIKVTFHVKEVTKRVLKGQQVMKQGWDKKEAYVI